jgi:hypothetical protein
MAEMLQFDAETARRVEAVYTTPDVVAQRRDVLRILALRPGETVVDIGAGPGFLAAEMAAAGRHGPGGDPVSAGLGPDHLPPDDAPQLADVGLDGGRRGDRQPLTPQAVGDAVLRDGPPARQQQDLEQLPRFDPAELASAHGAVRKRELERPEHADRRHVGPARHGRRA